MKENFLKMFANLPLPLRNEIIYVDKQYGPMTWNVVRLEVMQNTDIGLAALEFLSAAQII